MRPDEERNNRIRALFRYIVEVCNGETTLQDIYRFALSNWGYRFRTSTINSYLNALIMAGQIKINNNHVIYTGKKPKTEEEIKEGTGRNE